MQHTLLTDVCTCKGYLLHTRLHGLKNITAQQMLITAQQMLTHGMPQLLVGVSVECGYALYLGPESKVPINESQPKSVQLVKQLNSKS